MGFINNPTAATPALALPVSEVAFGSGTGVTSSPKLTYLTAGNQISLVDAARGGTVSLTNNFDGTTLILDTTANSVAKLHLKDPIGGFQMWSTLTTGASTATFVAANKPGGTNVTTPVSWIKCVDLNTFAVLWVPAFAN